MTSGMTEYALRERMREHGLFVNHGQLVTYEEHGLIERGDMGCWPEETERRLFRLHGLADRARSIPRRVVLLGEDIHLIAEVYTAPDMTTTPPVEGVHRSWYHPTMGFALAPEHGEFHVAADKLRDAMLAVIPTIDAAKRKMRQVRQALSHGQTYLYGPLRVSEHLPERGEWPELLRSVPLPLLEKQRVCWYLASKMLEEAMKDTDLSISEIPEEERIIIIALLDIADRLSSDLAEHDGDDEEVDVRCVAVFTR